MPHETGIHRNYIANSILYYNNEIWKLHYDINIIINISNTRTESFSIAVTHRLIQEIITTINPNQSIRFDGPKYYNILRL